MSIRVAVVDDQALVRGGFAMVLRIHDDIEVVAEAGTGLEAIEVARQHRPDVILMDIRMPDMDGLEATSRILAEADWNVRVLILTTFDPDEYVYKALRAGASGFVLKDIPADQLAIAVRTVADGGALLAPSITRRLIGQFTERVGVDAAVSRRLERLTDREREVVIAVARGPATPRSPRACSSERRPSSRTCRASSPSSACATAPSWWSSRTRAGWSRPAPATSATEVDLGGPPRLSASPMSRAFIKRGQPVLEPPSHSPAERALPGLDRFEGRIAVLKDQDVEAAGVGRRVFIKGLAATAPWSAAWPSAVRHRPRRPAGSGQGPRPPAAVVLPGWTSQPGKFFDDVSLPEGFTYDVVASYRDRIGGGETFGYNNDFIAYFP